MISIPDYVTPGVRARHSKSYETLHPYLQLVFSHTASFLAPHYACFPYLLFGHRGRTLQEELYAEGKSLANWGQSYHNFYPSLAFDVIPFWADSVDKIEWGSERTFDYLQQFHEHSKNYLTWGGHFKGKDYVHFQINSEHLTPLSDAPLNDYTLYSEPK